jgi:hypothetical protein
MTLARGRLLPVPGDHTLPDPDDIGTLAEEPGRGRTRP